MNHNRYKRRFLTALFLISTLIFYGCSRVKTPDERLDPQNPIVLTMWHYQGGAVQGLLEQKISEFNTTLGREKGIIIDARYKGNLSELSDAIYSASAKNIGSEPMPDIFSSFPEELYLIGDLVEIVNLEDYFSVEELSQYNSDFLENGRVDGAQKLLPIMKSTEVLYLNETDWKPFAEEMGLSEDMLSSWEGLKKAADLYYQWSGGQAFWGLDSAYNFTMALSRQYGQELVEVTEDGARFICPEPVARAIWDYYLVPGITGRSIKSGNYAHIDIQSSNSLAALTTTAGASYLPLEAVKSLTDSHCIQYAVLPYPTLDNGPAYAPLRGMDMCVKSSTPEREYAACLFLKWLTAPEQNVDLAAAIGYLPVRTDALREDILVQARQKASDLFPGEVITDAFLQSYAMSKEYTLYNEPPYQGCFEIKDFLNTRLPGYVKELSYLSDPGEEDFWTWYQTFLSEADSVLSSAQLKENP